MAAAVSVDVLESAPLIADIDYVVTWGDNADAAGTNVVDDDDDADLVVRLPAGACAPQPPPAPFMTLRLTSKEARDVWLANTCICTHNDFCKLFNVDTPMYLAPVDRQGCKLEWKPIPNDCDVVGSLVSYQTSVPVVMVAMALRRRTDDKIVYYYASDAHFSWYVMIQWLVDEQANKWQINTYDNDDLSTVNIADQPELPAELFGRMSLKSIDLSGDRLGMMPLPSPPNKH